MTQTIKVLGQLNPVANTLTPLYTVPSSTSTVVSSFTVCNVDSSTYTFNLSVAIGGASDNLAQYICWQVSIDTGDTYGGTIGITLAAGDVVNVYSTSSNFAFNLFGTENS